MTSRPYGPSRRKEVAKQPFQVDLLSADGVAYQYTQKQEVLVRCGPYDNSDMFTITCEDGQIIVRFNGDEIKTAPVEEP